mgnify:CR=1 FL=1
MQLFLVRHGVTVENEQGITQGHLPGKLSMKGMVQATRVAEKLSSITFDSICSSDLARALDTAKIIAAFHENTPFHIVQELRERKWGTLEGKKIKEQPYYETPRDTWPLPEDSESEEEVIIRVKKFLLQLLESHKNETVLCISHDETIKAILALCTNKDFGEIRTEFKIKATSVTIVNIEKLSEGKIKKFNDISHLQ